MNWLPLTDELQLAQIKENSFTTPVVLFKHSTRCSVSNMVKNRLERDTQPEGVSFYYLDLLTYRPISNKIAEDYKVYHASPQVLVIKNGECIYEESQMGITMDEIAEQVAAG